jgi:hypothetical protein
LRIWSSTDVQVELPVWPAVPGDRIIRVASLGSLDTENEVVVHPFAGGIALSVTTSLVWSVFCALASISLSISLCVQAHDLTFTQALQQRANEAHRALFGRLEPGSAVLVPGQRAKRGCIAPRRARASAAGSRRWQRPPPGLCLCHKHGTHGVDRTGLCLLEARECRPRCWVMS